MENELEKVKTSNRKPRTETVDWEAVGDLVEAGQRPADAMRVAGSKARAPSRVFMNKLSKDERFRLRIHKALKERVRWALEAIKRDAFDEKTPLENIKALSILLTHLNLIEGKSTQNIAVKGAIDILSLPKDEQVKAYRRFVHG